MRFQWRCRTTSTIISATLRAQRYSWCVGTVTTIDIVVNRSTRIIDGRTTHELHRVHTVNTTTNSHTTITIPIGNLLFYDYSDYETITIPFSFVSLFLFLSSLDRIEFQFNFHSLNYRRLLLFNVHVDHIIWMVIASTTIWCLWWLAVTLNTRDRAVDKTTLWLGLLIEYWRQLQ